MFMFHGFAIHLSQFRGTVSARAGVLVALSKEPKLLQRYTVTQKEGIWKISENEGGLHPLPGRGLQRSMERGFLKKAVLLYVTVVSSASTATRVARSRPQSTISAGIVNCGIPATIGCACSPRRMLGCSGVRSHYECWRGVLFCVAISWRVIKYRSTVTVFHPYFAL